MAADHGAMTILLAAVVLAVLGALRWDALLLWLRSLFEAPTPPSEPPVLRVPAPRHAGTHHHPTLQRRPAFHRSGRRA
ncbi:hypothetical protein SNE35_09475 [Paucibacter sp. R3-3]|uniref:Secreted protein n=1 Tax=Roseateles agri TaxID=3098619 RepID=A0ABU5DG60_9BURK|nr:hypothetical protein [Paucibacter sp. R3-3]MDY0744738.1 hypothetical protein [Paucibacter sp. R3-3]